MDFGVNEPHWNTRNNESEYDLLSLDQGPVSVKRNARKRFMFKCHQSDPKV